MQNDDPKYWALLTENDINTAQTATDDLMEVLKDFHLKKQPNLSILYLLKKVIEQAKNQGYSK